MGVAAVARDPKSFREEFAAEVWYPILEIVLLGYVAMLGIVAVGFILGVVARLVVWFFEGWM